MNQFEEFTKIYYHQIHEEENQGFAEEPKEELNLEGEEDDKINAKQNEFYKKDNQPLDTSNRLNSSQKRYITYTMEYKKRIIQEVKIKLIII